ncbi:hypothetical protein [uncultured Thalassospira sp.]|jgi:hypothetical protein
MARGPKIAPATSAFPARVTSADIMERLENRAGVDPFIKERFIA